MCQHCNLRENTSLAGDKHDNAILCDAPANTDRKIYIMETGAHHVSSQWFEENLTVKLKVNKKLNHIISWTRSYLCFTCIIGSPYKLIRKTDHFNEMHSGMLGSKRYKGPFNSHHQQSYSGNILFAVPSS